MTARRRLLAAAVALAGAAALLPSAASAQATRTWVSGVGDDANPCSRTAPCKTFAGAISKTAASGEIDALDPGGFGGVTITKSLSIRGDGQTTGVLVSGTNAIVVSAGANDRVTLEGLDVNGLGNGLAGVRVLSGKVVKVLDSEIYGFSQAGISWAPSTPNARLLVSGTHIHGNPSGSGIGVAPTAAGGLAVITHSHVEDSVNGVVVNGTSQPAVANVVSSSISGNDNGILALGALGKIRIAGDTIVGNGVGLSVGSGGTIESMGDNVVVGNGTDGAPTTTFAPKRR